MTKPVQLVRNCVPSYSERHTLLLWQVNAMHKTIVLFKHYTNLLIISCEVQKLDWTAVFLPPQMKHQLSSSNPYYTEEWPRNSLRITAFSHFIHIWAAVAKLVEGGLLGCSPALKIEIWKTHFVCTISQFAGALDFSHNQLLQSAMYQYTRILRNRIKNFECFWTKLRQPSCSDLVINHGKRCCVCVHINSVSNSVMSQLYLKHDFYNNIFTSTPNYT